MKTHLFLFPHQDDEAPLFFEIERCVRSGIPLQIVYLTTGQDSAEPFLVRNAESLLVLSRLGVPTSSVLFLGSELGVPDGRLQNHIEQLFQALIERVGRNHRVGCVHMPAWEGGHHDHDAAHLLGYALSKHWNCVESSDQFPHYHGRGLKGILFKTLDPLPENGPAILDRIRPRDRLRYCALLLNYRSQWLSWIGLGPFFVLHHVLRGTQVRQRVVEDRLLQRPHEGALLYERRAFSRFELLQQHTADFVATHITGAGSSAPLPP